MVSENEPVPGCSFDSGAVMLTPEAGAEKLHQYASMYHTLSQWEDRANQIKSAMMVGSELNPWPSLGIPEAVVHSKRAYNGYSVENVYFEAFPGFYITGNLYRPSARTGNCPGILINLGHFPLSRHAPENQYLASTLARMGAVVFIYDMMGYGESHQPGKSPPSNDHCFVKATKLELLDALRSLDFLSSLHDVDTKRLGVTGASGGGSRTMFLTALDPRVKACAPMIMVSSYYYGGCICESGMPICYKARIDTVLAEIAALAAPRPMLVVSDGQDWTNTVPSVEYPYIRRVYRLYGAEEKVSNIHLLNEGHDLGYNKRLAAYQFFAESFDLPCVSDENDTVLEAWSLQKAFSQAYPKPVNALSGDPSILRALDLI
jgi:uncharacterized protein